MSCVATVCRENMCNGRLRVIFLSHITFFILIKRNLREGSYQGGTLAKHSPWFVLSI
jgi:hypothetical protein